MKHTGQMRFLVLLSAVLLGACGSSGSVSPSAVHTAEPGEPGLIQVVGYQYEDDAEGAEWAAAEMKEFNESEPGPDIFVGTSIHRVKRDQDDLGILGISLLQYNDELAAIEPEDVDIVFEDLRSSWPEASVTVETIATQEVAFSCDTDVGDGVVATIFGWQHHGVVTEVMGENAADTREFVEKYLEAAHPSRGDVTDSWVDPEPTPTPTPSGVTVTWTDVRVGDCIYDVWADDNVLVPCSDPHSGEVIFTDESFYARDSAAPPEDTVTDREAAAAEAALQVYTGLPPDDGPYWYLVDGPDAAEWGLGIRRFVVYGTTLDSALNEVETTGSMAAGDTAKSG